MKRVLELVYKILVATEKSNYPMYSLWRNEMENEFPGYSQAQINEHLTLCVAQGYLRCLDDDDIGWHGNLTWAGHDYLDSIRDSHVDIYVQKGGLGGKKDSIPKPDTEYVVRGDHTDSVYNPDTEVFTIQGVFLDEKPPERLAKW